MLHVKQLFQLSVSELAALSGGLLLVYILAIIFYRVFLHPLKGFPGPLIDKITDLSYSFSEIRGEYPWDIADLHRQYGPVVRVAPNRVSFNTVTSWRDIYTHVGGRKFFLKSSEYNHENGPSDLVTERDPVKYGQMRRLFSEAFSAKSLQEQEDIIHKYTNLLIRQLDTGDKVNGENMVKWFNLTTFDMVGDLGFGGPFGALEKGNYHFWVLNVVLSVRSACQVRALERYPLARCLLPLFVPKGAVEKQELHLQYSMEKVKRRLGMPNTRKDFLTKILAEREAQGITMLQLATHANTFVIAGSETSSTALAAILYYLLKSPPQYKKLMNEVRSAFPRYEDITGTATDHMVYMRAVINEGLRIYPPVPNGPSRVSPGEFVDGIWIPKGVEVFTSAFAAHRDPGHFTRADEFHAERWIGGNDEFANDKLSASQPFSLGPRGCIGKNLALMEMKLILAKLFWFYDMELMNKAVDLELDSKVWTLWNKPDLIVRLIRREGVELP